MPDWGWFIIGAILSTFVGGLFFAILRARGYNPIGSLASNFAKTPVSAPAATVA